MGNSQNKTSSHRNPKLGYSERESQAFTSQFSLSHFVGNLSGRSFASVTSNQSVYSASRPWSRVSRRRWNDSTLKNPLEASKTAWPVSNKESIFLPEFPITTDLLQKDFVIEQTIAKGAFGKVYKVKKVSEDKEYALKVLSKAQVVTDNALRQVKEEARIQTACGHHSFIAGALSRWQTKKRLYIVSEYIPGGELLALLDKYGKLPEQLVKLFVAEIAIVLDFLHNAGVIYRDLKPENILLDSECHIRLVDFGLSKWLSLGSKTNTICGTLNYMAPEVLSREPYGHAVDWWALGVLICKMLTNKFPTPAAGVRATEHEQVNAEIEGDSKQAKSVACTSANSGQEPQIPGTLPACASELSSAARGLLLRLLDRDPRVRMRNIRQLQQSAFYMGFNFEHVKAKKFPTPAAGVRATEHEQVNAEIEGDSKQAKSVACTSANSGQEPQTPGTLPACASELSSAARGLLLRLLDRDPRVRMRNIRQLQQSAFYMGFNFEHVKAKKISPKSIIEKHFPYSAPDHSKELCTAFQDFTTLDQHSVIEFK